MLLVDAENWKHGGQVCLKLLNLESRFFYVAFDSQTNKPKLNSRKTIVLAIISYFTGYLRAVDIQKEKAEPVAKVEIYTWIPDFLSIDNLISDFDLL